LLACPKRPQTGYLATSPHKPTRPKLAAKYSQIWASGSYVGLWLNFMYLWSTVRVCGRVLKGGRQTYRAYAGKPGAWPDKEEM